MAEKEGQVVLEKRKPVRLNKTVEMVIIHMVPLLAFFTGATWFDWTMAIVLYFVRMFFITGFYHRYFSHHTFKTSRWFQFIMAFLAQTSMQKGVLWWGAHHRVHHRTSDTPNDPHSMKLYGFWYSHIGWILGPDYKDTDYKGISDFSKYKELVWLNKYYVVPPVALMLLLMILGGIVNGGSIMAMFSVPGGLSTLLIGFFLSTVVLYHGTFSINSIMHKLGKKRYESGDESRNSIILALVTLGEGWHNNHHYYQSSTRQGFFWWEIDITYYLLKMMSWVRLVWDIKEVPKHIKYSKNKEEAIRLKKKYAL
ncbi:MAG: acyl-CoA desaturase [Bacteroidota bacterium]